MTVLYELATTRNPMRPPFSKGDIEQPAKFPLFEKEGLGEIFELSVLISASPSCP